jgi:hypothetical protein
VPTQGLKAPCYENSVKMANADVATLGGAVDLLLLHFPPLSGCTPVRQVVVSNSIPSLRNASDITDDGSCNSISNFHRF